MSTWPNAIATNSAGLATLDPATPWADSFRRAARACPVSQTISNCPPSESLAYAQDLLNEGLAFNAHEVLEAAWKNGPDDERPLWQGLAQLAVGITHVQRGNRDGATTLLRRGSGRLGEVDHPAPHFVDVDGLVVWAAALVDDLAAVRRGLTAAPAPGADETLASPARSAAEDLARRSLAAAPTGARTSIPLRLFRSRRRSEQR